MEIIDKILSLTRQLYPSGRAFKMPVNSYLFRLHRALSISMTQAYNDAVSTLDSTLPDNSNFTADDATDWERRLGMVSNPLVPLSDRKLAIIRKMNHPGTIKARQNYLYIQGQLQAAGFNVFVYENIFPGYPSGFITKTPAQFSIPTYPTAAHQYSSLLQYGQVQYGGTPGNKIANSIYQSEDDAFAIGNSLRFTFFIGGSTAGSWADVDVNREVEFRKLILTLKPANTVGFLLINYV